MVVTQIYLQSPNTGFERDIYDSCELSFQENLCAFLFYRIGIDIAKSCLPRALNVTAFPNSSLGWFWSTDGYETTANAVHFRFGYNYVRFYDDNVSHRVRLVRDGKGASASENNSAGFTQTASSKYLGSNAHVCKSAISLASIYQYQIFWLGNKGTPYGEYAMEKISELLKLGECLIIPDGSILHLPASYTSTFVAGDIPAVSFMTNTGILWAFQASVKETKAEIKTDLSVSQPTTNVQDSYTSRYAVGLIQSFTNTSGHCANFAQMILDIPKLTSMPESAQVQQMDKLLEKAYDIGCL